MNIVPILDTKKTVFTVLQVGQILGMSDMQQVRNQLTRRKKQGLFKNIHWGIRALPNFDTYELANTLKTPSYISLETVLSTQGIVFQFYGNTIYSIADNTKVFSISNTTYHYHRITPQILLNPAGIEHHQGVTIACAERALCDRLYLTPSYHFDNLRPINWQKAFSIAEIYGNKRLLLDLDNLKHGTK